MSVIQTCNECYIEIIYTWCKFIFNYKELMKCKKTFWAIIRFGVFWFRFFSPYNYLKSALDFCSHFRTTLIFDILSNYTLWCILVSIFSPCNYLKSALDFCSHFRTTLIFDNSHSIFFDIDLHLFIFGHAVISIYSHTLFSGHFGLVIRITKQVWLGIRTLRLDNKTYRYVTSQTRYPNVSSG